MDNSSTHALIALGAIGLLALLLTRIGRIITAIAIVLVILVAMARLFVRTSTCTAPACRIALQQTYCGPCMPLNGTIEKREGHYVLSGTAGAQSLCLNWMFWR